MIIDTLLPPLLWWMAFLVSRQRRRLNEYPVASRKSERNRTHAPAGTWRVEWSSLLYRPLITASGRPGFQRPVSTCLVTSGKMARASTSSGKKGSPPCPLTSEFNCVLQHSIRIQRTIYDLDDCIMSLILVDQILTVLYNIID